MNEDRNAGTTNDWVRLEQSELYFLVARFLEQGPCQKAAKALREELEEKELLVRGKSWEGEDKVLSFEEITKRNQHVSPDFLSLLCQEFCKLLESSGHCRTNGAHSLVGNEISSFVYRNCSVVADNLHSLLNKRHGFTSSHLPNSAIVNQCTLFSAAHLSPLCSHSIQLQQPSLFTHMKKHRVILGHLAPVFCVSFDSTGQRIITGADDDLAKVWSSQSGQLIATLRGHHAELTDVSISWDNGVIATGSLDKTVRVWCGQSSAPLAVLSGHGGHITSVQLSPSPDEDNRYLASTGKDGCLFFWKWDPDSLRYSDTPHKFMEKNRISDQTLCSAFSPGGKFYVTGGTDRIVRIYYCCNYPVLMDELSGHQDRVMTIQFSNTGQCLFATGSCDGTAIIWQYRQSRWSSIVLAIDELKTASSSSKSDKAVHSSQVTMVGWERTDTYLVTAHTPDCHLRVWKARTGQQFSLLKGHSNEVFVVECHPNESRVLLTAGHDGQVIIWDMFTGVKLKIFQIEYEDEGIPCIFDCKWSPDGLLCAAADSFGYLTIFGFGSSTPYEQHPDEQFFHTDYRPLMRDRNHFVIDEQAQLPPHLLPPPYLVDIDGHPHPAKYQEAILQYIRPAERLKQDKRVEEQEDYNEYMRKHFVNFEEQRRSFQGRTRERLEVTRSNSNDSKPIEKESSSQIDEGVVNTPIYSTQSEPDSQSKGISLSDELVDVMENDGRDENIQNMLSSIVYSLGLNEEEARVAIGYWHRRNILPPLDSATVSSEQARLHEIREEEDIWYKQESEKHLDLLETTPPTPPTPQGRALRSGRTIDTEDLPIFSPSRDGESDRDTDSDAHIDEAWESGSTASSDISDWTNEAGYNMSLSHSRSRRTRRRESTLSDVPFDITINEELNNDEKLLPNSRNSSVSTAATRDEKRPPIKRPVKKGIDYSIYWPPDWLKLKSPQISPYFPQVGDIVVYCYQGHKLYCDEVKTHRIYQWKNQQLPWQKYQLRPQEFCLVKNVHFVVGPPTLCSITLTLLTSSASTNSDAPSTSQKKPATPTFTFKYHDMDNVLDFLILESIYKRSIHKPWTAGSQFKSLIDGSYWTGTVLQRQPHQETVPNSYWQCYHVEWEDGATDQLSPWDMEEINESSIDTGLVSENEEVAWGGREEQERILRGLELVMDELDEAEMFVHPVDLEEERVYCTVVPFPTNLSAIAEKLRNGFYRRKLALIWEVILLSRNAASYNEQDSVIVKHSKILTQTLLKFIKSPLITDPLSCYQPDLNDEDSLEITAPEVDFEVESEEVFLPQDPVPSSDTAAAANVTDVPLRSSSRKRRVKKLSSDDEFNVVTEEEKSWVMIAETLLEEICAHEDSYPFLKPVDLQEYPEYIQIIAVPMDLSTIQEKLESECYTAADQFVDDMNLIFNNAKKYNQTRSQVYKMASQLQNLFNGRVRELMNGVSLNHTPQHHHYNTRKALEKIAGSLSSLDNTPAVELATGAIVGKEMREELEQEENELLNNQEESSDDASDESDLSYEREDEEDEEMEEEVEEEVEEETEEDVIDMIPDDGTRMTRSRSKRTHVQRDESDDEYEEEMSCRQARRRRKRKRQHGTSNKQIITRSSKRKRVSRGEGSTTIRSTRTRRVSTRLGFS